MLSCGTLLKSNLSLFSTTTYIPHITVMEIRGYKKTHDGNKNESSISMEKMDEIDVALKKFGGEKSTLLDQYERLSFEIQLNQAILGRSLSEPRVSRNRTPLPPPPPPPIVKNVGQGKRRNSTAAVAGFRKVIKKLLKPFVGKKQGKNEDLTTPTSTPKDHKFHKILSSMSVKS